MRSTELMRMIQEAKEKILVKVARILSRIGELRIYRICNGAEKKFLTMNEE